MSAESAVAPQTSATTEDAQVTNPPASVPALVRMPAECHVAMIVARLIVGGVFIWLAIGKIEKPIEFLKVIREYHVIPPSLFVLHNLTAVALPWIEIFAGVCLVLGLWLRGSALLLLLLLLFFTIAIARRALGVYQAGGIPFCGIKFDCGCGGGTEIYICDKLRENVALIGLALIAALSDSRWLAADRRRTASQPK